MKSEEFEKEYLSNDEDINTETKTLKEKDNKEIINNNNLNNKNKNSDIKNTCLIIISFVVIMLILIILLIYIRITSNLYLNKSCPKFNLRKSISNKALNNNSNILSNIPNVSIIEDIKNIINNQTDEIINKNKTKEKIGIAFIYSTLYSNGIARFITVTSKNLLKTGKYNIFFITGKPYYKEFSYEPEIKRYIAHNNYTLIRNISKHEKIDIVVLQNVLSTSVVKFYKNLGQKVICMFHGVFMSSMYSNYVESYRSWEQFDSCDSFIFIASDDYYFYNHLGFKNAIFIPNLYTFEPSEIKNSNLTNHNIVILGRLNDFIKGVKYAIEAMQYIVKEVPDATLNLFSSDGRIQFLKNLTRDLNLTKNVIFRSNTYNLSQLFYNVYIIIRGISNGIKRRQSLWYASGRF